MEVAAPAAAAGADRPARRSCLPKGRCRCCLCLFAVGAVLLAALAAALAVRRRRRREPAGYSQERAIQFAKLAGAAYCPGKALESWTCGEKCIPGVANVRVCPGESTKALTAVWEGRGLVSFEGTHTYWSMVQDLRTWQDMTPWDSCDGCMVHTGFLSEWLSLKTCVEASLEAAGQRAGSEIRVVGHSLGAAVSSLAMVSLTAGGWQVAESYNFGMPRTGDSHFARTFTGLFRGRFHRVTHHMDPVPHLPPEDLNFMHAAGEVFYDGGLDAGYVECRRGESTRCSGQYWDVVRDMIHLDDHLNYMGVQTGSAGCLGSSGAGMRANYSDGTRGRAIAQVSV